jgi:pyruvate/2-oxoacid:ferredoxin oxidoreductase alpha subunit
MVYVVPTDRQPVHCPTTASTQDDHHESVPLRGVDTLVFILAFTTASHGSNDAAPALKILDHLCTPSSILFDPEITSRQKPSAAPPFRTFPPSPTNDRRPPPHVPSTISLQNLDIEATTAEMDKRHPSSFQQLEKLGEGTYATVRPEMFCCWTTC